MGYHKRVPQKKFNVRPDNRPRRVQWAREHLSWTYEEWKRVLWTDESSFSTAGFGHRPWVIRSPDLNLIEALWGDLEVELGQIWGRVSDPEALEAAVKAAWDSITEERLEELIRSMPARLQAVIDTDGHPTPY